MEPPRGTHSEPAGKKVRKKGEVGVVELRERDLQYQWVIKD